jgi:hypothetical protein
VKSAPLLIVCCILLAGCAAPLTYAPDVPLSAERFSSRDSILRGRIPPGWFVSTQDTLAPALQTWLLMQDFSAEILFREIQLDSSTRALIASRGLDELATFVRSFHTEENGGASAGPESFSLGGNTFSAFELGTGSGRMRVAVFAKGGKYYECAAHALKESASSPRGEALFRIQQSVLSSLEQ